jgi:hypothetical protein
VIAFNPSRGYGFTRSIYFLLSPGTPYYAYYIQGAQHAEPLRINYKNYVYNRNNKKDYDKACFEFLLINTLIKMLDYLKVFGVILSY